MNTFKEREDKENKYAWTKFKKWLDEGGWKYKYFRYPKELTNTEINDFSIPPDVKIRFKKLLKSINFDHDGMMNRGKDTWFFDLKYKSHSNFINWVNKDDYEAYYELSTVDIPFLLVVYVHNEDKLYFHKVRNPKLEPKPIQKWDAKARRLGGQKYVFLMPKQEYQLISGFEVPWKHPEDSAIRYYIWAMKIQEAYNAWINKEPYTSKSDAFYKEKVLRKFEQGLSPQIWLNSPLARFKVNTKGCEHKGLVNMKIMKKTKKG